MSRFMVDAQAALSFLVSNISYIETEVARTEYPEITYAQHIPIDYSAPDWVKSITYYSVDTAGQADWFHHAAKDIPLADVSRAKFEVGVEMAAIGYRYDLEELGQAMLVGMPLTSEKALAASRAAEMMLDSVAYIGDTRKNWTGLVNNASVTVVMAMDDGVQNGAVDSPRWEDKTADQIIRDINSALGGVFTESLTVEIADTILLPITAMNTIATRRLGPDSDRTVLDFIVERNVYTHQTGRPLTIRQVRQLETAGTGSTGRMVVYRRAPDVLKMHIPMSHRFLQVWQTGPLTFDVPGIMRTGPVDIRRPGAFRYVDGISGPAYQ